jgi:hypothetical protein
VLGIGIAALFLGCVILILAILAISRFLKVLKRVFSVTQLETTPESSETSSLLPALEHRRVEDGLKSVWVQDVCPSEQRRET